MSKVCTSNTEPPDGVPVQVPGACEARAWAAIDLAAFRFNLQQVKGAASPSTAVMAVVKADAYGHGLVPIAKTAAACGAAWIGVATVGEGIALRGAGVTGPVALLCTPARSEIADLVYGNLTPLVGDADLANAIVDAAHRLRLPAPVVHLDVDTGMGRAGALPEETVDLYHRFLEMGLRVSGVSTHCADADGPDAAFSHRQFALFRRVVELLTAAAADLPWIHVANSAAALRFPVAHHTLVRPGLLLYGIRPPRSSRSIVLKPVMTLGAQVASVRKLPAGHPISYGATERLRRASVVATVLIGYGDGYPRSLSGRGTMLLHGCRAPILGRVCMDQTVVDVTDIPGVEPGDAAVCIGASGAERITVEQIAALIDTTDHEITTCIAHRIPRVYRDSHPD